MNAVLTDDGKIELPTKLRENAQLQPGDTLDVQFYKGSIVLRKHHPLTPEQCATLLERSRSQPQPTLEDDAAVEQAIQEKARPAAMIVVLDTNIVVSATYWRGKPAHCLEAWTVGKYDLAISHPILTEYEEVIDRLAARYPTKQPTDWLSAIKQAGHLYLPLPLPASTDDPDDEIFVECAAVARADYLVTGDKGHLLALKAAAGIPIVTVSHFLRLLGVPENPT